MILLFFISVLLTIGFAIWDDHVAQIPDILSSYVDHLTRDDTRDVTIVMSVSRQRTPNVKKILKERFSSHVDSGLIHLICPTEEYIRAFGRRLPLTNLHHKEFSQQFTEKMIALNENTGFLLYYASALSEYTLYLTDQNTVTGRFIPEIKHHIDKHRNDSYFALVFSGMWLMSQSILEKVNEFYTMFGRYSTPEILRDFHRVKLSQNALIETGTKLFPLKSVECERPKASLETSLEATTALHSIGDIYLTAIDKMFWAGTPKNNDYVQVTFDNIIKLSRVYIVTGSPYFMDIAKKAVLRACPAKDDGKSCDTARCNEIASFGDPIQDIKGLDTTIKFPVKCLRFQFTAKGSSWVMFRNIAVWTAP